MLRFGTRVDRGAGSDRAVCPLHHRARTAGVSLVMGVAVLLGSLLLADRSPRRRADTSTARL